MMNRFVILVVALGAGLGAGLAHAQPDAQPAPPGPQPDATKQREWSRTMHKTKVPKKGCFEAHYPATTWTEVPCKPPVNVPLVPAEGPRPTTIGNGNDISALASGTITHADGSFSGSSGIVSVSSQAGTSTIPDAFSIQLNTNTFASAACSTAAGTACMGWQQFVFRNDGATRQVFIQYWLLHYNKTCPSGWTEFPSTVSTDIHCYKGTSTGSLSAPAPITGLAGMTLSGTADGTSEQVTFDDGTNAASTTGDSSLSLAASTTHWKAVELNVFGAIAASQAVFVGDGTAPVRVQPKVEITDGSTTAPTCSAEGFTGETNNLKLASAASVSGPTPTLVFTEGSDGNVTGCSGGTSTGDTHLSTVAGLLYDFQASGDFVLAEAGQDFAVHARQVSGAPNWPNASINQAVAARFGNTTVAVCLADGGARVLANGKPIEFGQQPRLIAKDLTATRNGNSYTFTSSSGNSLRADTNATYINVYLGFGSSAVPVRGLIANANNNVNQIAARNGNALTNPFAFDALYHTFADSWRVTGQDTLLAPCGAPAAAGIPASTFTAQNLPPEVRKNAEAACTTAKVAAGALFDACIIDVAFFGNNTAADVFTTLPPPAGVGKITGGTGDTGGTKPPPRPFPWRWLVLGLVVLLLLALLLLRKRRP